jgi:hypothetical protein
MLLLTFWLLQHPGQLESANDRIPIVIGEFALTAFASELQTAKYRIGQRDEVSHISGL